MFWLLARLLSSRMYWLSELFSTTQLNLKWHTLRWLDWPSEYIWIGQRRSLTLNLSCLLVMLSIRCVVWEKALIASSQLDSSLLVIINWALRLHAHASILRATHNHLSTLHNNLILLLSKLWPSNCAILLSVFACRKRVYIEVVWGHTDLLALGMGTPAEYGATPSHSFVEWLNLLVGWAIPVGHWDAKALHILYKLVTHIEWKRVICHIWGQLLLEGACLLLGHRICSSKVRASAVWDHSAVLAGSVLFLLLCCGENGILATKGLESSLWASRSVFRMRPHLTVQRWLEIELRTCFLHGWSALGGLTLVDRPQFLVAHLL
jgi:hypothetical protein